MAGQSVPLPRSAEVSAGLIPLHIFLLRLQCVSSFVTLLLHAVIGDFTCRSASSSLKKSRG